MSKEKPILFSGPMVRAILEGRKTQTRRIVADANTQGNWKPSECDLSSAFVDPGPSPSGNPGPYLKALVTREALKAHGWTEDDEIRDRIYPRVFPGDRLWVRETWKYRDWTEDGEPFISYRASEDDDPIHIDASRYDDEWGDRLAETWAALSDPDNYQVDGRASDRKWRPAIFMPRWASRITLEVTEVRVHRLHEISEEDATSEGVSWPEGAQEQNVRKWGVPQTARMAYADLWDYINGTGSWDANPWVWAYTFERSV